MVRDYIIYADEADFEIRLVGCDSYKKYKGSDIPAFGILKADDKGLVYIYDICVEIYLKEAKKHEAFYQKANFYIQPLGDLSCYPNPKAKQFKGTFIDALELIRDNWGKLSQEYDHEN